MSLRTVSHDGFRCLSTTLVVLKWPMSKINRNKEVCEPSYKVEMNYTSTRLPSSTFSTPLPTPFPLSSRRSSPSHRLMRTATHPHSRSVPKACPEQQGNSHIPQKSTKKGSQTNKQSTILPFSTRRQSEANTRQYPRNFLRLSITPLLTFPCLASTPPPPSQRELLTCILRLRPLPFHSTANPNHKAGKVTINDKLKEEKTPNILSLAQKTKPTPNRPLVKKP